MIDLMLLREQPARVFDLVARKDPKYPTQRLAELDIRVRDLQQEVEALRSERNELARTGKSGLVAQATRDQAKAIGGAIKEKEAALALLEADFRDLYLRCPNLPLEELPLGGKESNQSVREFGLKPGFSFTPKTHVDLATTLGWIDFEAAARMTASHFALYKGMGVRLQYALSMFMLNTAQEYGYAPVLPPFLINEKALEGASNFPRFREEVFAVEKDGLYLTPTAEVNLANLYRDSIFSSDELPIRHTALTSCFRREAGGYGSSERGLIRIHQFDKVELFAFCKPEESAAEQDRMLACAESILKRLGLHYRVMLLAAQDCSFASAKTYDLEVWMPGQGEYKEVSSISNCTDFQARRCMMRYRTSEKNKKQLIHTLNGSSLALPRLFVAILETYQQADGTVQLPDVLRSVSVGV